MAGRNDSMNSVIGPGSIFEGKFYISGSLKIDGKFEGEIKTEDALVVGETGKIKT
ncbi:MAG TPA: polymer-forming cytoskeletal protein, partial [Leptospiraceae bacterium]|nr:polymer-forming cytoskeletal protein [Leptospiraceae bacterium]